MATAAATAQIDWSCESEAEDWEEGSSLLHSAKIQRETHCWQSPEKAEMKLRAEGERDQPRDEERWGPGCWLLMEEGGQSEP